MANSRMQLVSDGNLSVVPLTIKFFEQSHIGVYIDDVALPTAGYSYVWSGATTITITPTVAFGVEVVIRRRTPADYVLHDFQAGAVFSETSIDENFRQDLFLLQEASEQSFITDLYDNLNMHGNKLVNLGVATSANDAVSLGQVKTLVEDSGGSPYVRVNVAELHRRSYAESGLDLVDGSCEAGATLSAANSVVLYGGNGKAYAHAGPYPYDVVPNTDPTAPSSGYVPRADVFLRDIAQTRVVDISELVSFSDKSSSVCMHEFHAGSGIGGGLFRWNGSASKTLHDGGRYIDPDKALPDWPSESSVAAWLTASLSGSGVWERIRESREIDAAWFGIIPQNSTTQISSRSQLRKLLGIITSGSTGLDTRMVCKFPSGTYYTTDTLTVDTAFFIDYQFDGFELKFTDDSSPTGDAVIIFNSPVQCSWDGSHIINANDKTKYPIAFDRATGSGTSGGFSSGLVTMNAQWQVRISAPDTTTLFSEFTFSNYRSYGCKNGIHASGYNTVVTINGASLVSVLDPADPIGLDSCTILVEGATVNVAGGELVRPGTTTGNLVNIRPASNGKYGNVRVNGAHIETSAPLCNISNPESYTLNQSVGGLTVVGCGGYTGGSPTASFITTEPNFDGGVAVKGCDFYRDTLSVARIIDAQGPCRHDIDSGTWDGFTQIKWGGIDVSGKNQTLSVNGLPAVTIPAGDAILKFQAVTSDASATYLASLYSASTGKFTVPPYGPYDVDINCSVYTPGITGSLSVMAGASLLAVADIGASGVGYISALLRGLNYGTEITVHIQSSTPSSGSSFVAALNQLNITARKTV